MKVNEKANIATCNLILICTLQVIEATPVSTKKNILPWGRKPGARTAPRRHTQIVLPGHPHLLNVSYLVKGDVPHCNAAAVSLYGVPSKIQYG